MFRVAWLGLAEPEHRARALTGPQAHPKHQAQQHSVRLERWIAEQGAAGDDVFGAAAGLLHGLLRVA